MVGLTAAALKKLLGVAIAGKLAKGAAGFVGGRKQARAEEDRALLAQQEAKALTGKALTAREDYGLGESFSDLRQLVMQDPTSDYLRQQQLRSEATQLDTLAGGGARALLGGSQAVAQSGMDRLAQIAAEEQQRKAKGLQAVGQAEQRVAEQKLADARTDLALGRGLGAEALAAQYGAEDLKRQVNVAGVGTAVDAASTAAIGGIEGIQNIDPFLWQQIMGGSSSSNPWDAEKGGIVRGKTPGEFSHEENPIDVVQDGEKIGEMTGGEGIVSPEDLGQLQQLAGKGDTELHKFVRSLISKLESNGEE